MAQQLNLCFWTTIITLAVGVISQDCTFDNLDSPLCSWVPDDSNTDYVWKLWEGETPRGRTGPSADHTSGAGKYVFAQSSVQGTNGLQEIPRRSRTRFTSPTIHTSWVPKVMRFYYYMYGKHVGILNVFVVVRGAVGINSPTWRKTRNEGQLWKLGELSIPANSTIKIVFEAVTGKGIMGDIAIDDITFHDALADCTFEDEVPDPVCRFEQDTNDNFDWQSNNGKTPTRRTGPSKDHTLDNSRGHYMYIESSGPNTNDKAYLVSPRYAKEAGFCQMSFWYHMYGEHIGHLKVHIMTRPGNYGSPAWTEVGDHGNEWHEAVVNITDYVGQYQIAFEGIRGTGHEGDIAVDDIKFLGIDCITQESFQELTTNETSRDYCVTSPCQNGGVCESGIGRYICACAHGWSGTDCHIEAAVDNCESTPCMNEGTCNNLPQTSSYRCECPRAWSGTNCEIDESEVDKCESSPCLNEATCTSLDTGYECTCTEQWNGTNCEEDVDECVTRTPCANGGTCENTEGSYNCTCPGGWHGRNCDTACEDTNENCDFWAGVGECSSNPRYMLIYCQLSCGVCQDYVCEDKHDNCVKWSKIGECKSNPFFMLANCHKSCGVCIDDECSSEPCLNNGTCTDGDNAYNCTCATGFEGDNCEIDVDECLSQPCQNSGTCVDEANGYSCNCTDMYEGAYCENKVTPCSSDPCVNNGTCTNEGTSFICTCPPGFRGNQCEIDVDECESSPCLHEGRCENRKNGFLCHCVQEWTGPTCEKDFDECGSNPCQNGATCFHGVGLDFFLCTCAEGWQGKFCQMEVNECESSPCQNEGMCLDKFGGYTCECLSGWQGTNCEIEIQECASNPCLNGRCVEYVNKYTCLCFPGFNGTNCEIAIDECASNPCQNGAQCEDQHNGHLCICLEGFQGRYCEEVITTPKPTTTAPTTQAATTTVQTTERATTQPATTKPATTKPATTRLAKTKLATSKVVITKLKTQQPTRPAVHLVHPTTEDWVPNEFEESSLGDSEYSGVVDETEKPSGNAIPETSTSNNQQSGRGTNNVVSTVRNVATKSKDSDKDQNEVTILQAIPVSKTSGQPQETVSRRSNNASHDNLHAPTQVAPIGHIIAIVVGAVFVITILAFLIILVVRQKKKARIGRYEHFSMDFKQDPVAWKDLDNRSDDTDPDLAVAKM